MKKIMLADDNERVLRVLEAVLRGPDTEVLSISDPAQVLAVAGHWGPDLLILDVSMPGLDGFEVCAALRREARTRGIAIVMLTGQSDVGSRLRGIEAGADLYLTKPFRSNILSAQIKRLLSGTQGRGR